MPEVCANWQRKPVRISKEACSSTQESKYFRSAIRAFAQCL